MLIRHPSKALKLVSFSKLIGPIYLGGPIVLHAVTGKLLSVEDLREKLPFANIKLLTFAYGIVVLDLVLYTTLRHQFFVFIAL